MKKALAIILMIVLVFGAFPVMSVLSSADDTPALAGKGTETEPYLIGSKADFIAFNTYVNGGTGWGNSCSGGKNCDGVYFLLTDDVDMTGETYVPVGYWNGVFKGTFDGGNHTIKGLTSDHSSGYTMACFAANANGAVIKNLTIENALVTGNNTVGIVVGNAVNTRIENVTLAGTCSATASNDKVAGFAGQADTDTAIVNCTISGDLTAVSNAESGYNKCVGGFIGNDNGAVIDGATISGSVSVSTKCQCAAGVVGLAGGDSVIRNVVISGKVNAAANTNVAAIVGQTESGSPVVIDGVKITDTAVITVSGYDGGQTSSGGGVIIGCSWAGNHTVKNVEYSGTATIYGGGGDGNGFVFGKMNAGTQTVYNVKVGGKITFNASFYNYGLVAGKIQGGMVNAVSFIADGEVAFDGGANYSKLVGDLTDSGTLNGINIDTSKASFNKTVNNVNGSGSLNLIASEGAYMVGDALVIRDADTDSSNIDNLVTALGIRNVYVTSEIEEAFRGAFAEAVVIPILSVETDIRDANSFTVVGALNVEDLYYDKLEMTVNFMQGGETVKTKIQDFTTVSTTVTDCASVNYDTAYARGIEYIPGAAYLVAFQINNIPAGTYDVSFTFNGISGDTVVTGTGYDTQITVE